jgi:peptide/nickel transport system permease protein
MAYSNASSDVFNPTGRYRLQTAGRILRHAGAVLLKLVVTLLAVTALVYALTTVPGDPAKDFIGPDATPAQVAIFQQKYGLDKPLVQRYVDWISGVLQGRWGYSYGSDTPVWSLIKPRLWRTLPLLLATWLLTGIVGVGAGLLLGLRSGTRGDTAATFLALTVVAIPEFVIALLLLTVFAVKLRWLPANSSQVALESDPLRAWQAYLLPCVTLAIPGSIFLLRLTRASVRETADQPYVRAAVLHGLPSSRVKLRHVLPNASPPIVNALALRLAAMFAGVVVVETVFGFPGMGQLLVMSTESRDAPTVQAIVVLIATVFVLMNVLADAIVGLLVPKRRETIL